uniref:C-type lectin domain-containing protein n=1 Tax=Seriola dumerili TaxID=41447 RepID=A0A3B4UC68_SERDU
MKTAKYLLLRGVTLTTCNFCLGAANGLGRVGKRTYTAINNSLTWSGAQTYCRTYHTDLAMIENAQENAEVMSVKLTDIAWIGLYREPWRWSDNSSSSFRNWQSREPDNSQKKEHCAAERLDHAFADLDCNSELAFWCYKGKKIRSHKCFAAFF